MGTSYKFTGGKELQRKLEEISKKCSKKAVLAVGFPKGAHEIDGTPTAMVAFFNEFGRMVHVKNEKGKKVASYFQMPRPFFRNFIAKGEPHWGEDLGDILVKVDYDIIAAFKILGDVMAGELQQSIQDLTSPPLAPSTIKHKGFSKPLIDTKVMWQSVTYWVDEEMELS